jgi:hypothetical protein
MARSLLISTFLTIARALRRWRGWILFTIAALTILVIVSAALVAVHDGWDTATSDSIECQVGFQPLPFASNGYVEFFLEKQQLAEPLFDGSYFINLTQEYGKNPMQLRVTTTRARNYGNTTGIASFTWNASVQELWMTNFEKMDFVSQKGSHRNFPFDSAHFDFAFRTEPAVNIPVIRFNNRVPGFYMPCTSVSVKRSDDGSLKVLFDLRRDRLTQFAAIMLFGAGVIFAFAITFSVEAKSLPTAVASYFFSLWSIRGIFGLGADGFPTLLDVGILALCMLILLSLAVRILKAKFQILRRARGQPFNTSS